MTQAPSPAAPRRGHPQARRHARHRALLAAGAALLAAGLTACATGSPADGSSGSGSAPQVVVTTNILGDVVEQIAGDEAEVTTLMRPNADPHSFEISAQEAALLDDAELIVSNGLGLEEGLQQHLDRALDGDATAVVAGDHVRVLDYSSADAAGAPDPHFWTDPQQMIAVVDAVEAELVRVPGVDAAAVRANAEAYRGELSALDREMAEAFATIPEDRRALVTNHHVFGYLAERYDFRLIGAVIPGGTTLASPSAAELSELAAAIEEAGVPAIFAESSQPDRLVQVLASEAGVRVDVVELFTESLTEPGEGADSYLTMMRANTERVTDGLSR
ncbi:zinc ABC transporter substrate-binding protein AztC [Leucobacter massiliensis]|uniref:Zinc ABC transporter substrate-binding protein n=1 Tax=Leucobacter massiliensis TaxID=1686285 RepID=A0A2S9QSS2_9MICO|nr:zinc ABC transporter substrate-binding protein AztC [Leucobacter massiliensis]PRI12643.1 zinc ABC transporter substrate-binding protein [Leucobacter massiliensis]